MAIPFRAVILKDKDKEATGIQVPAEIIAALGSGKKPKVKADAEWLHLPHNGRGCGRRVHAPRERGDQAGGRR